MTKKTLSATVAAILVSSLFLATPASATPPATSAVGDDGATSMSVDDILRQNPAARVVGRNSVEIADGVVLRLPEPGPAPGGSAMLKATCAGFTLCTWEHSFWDGSGYGIDFYYCGDYDLRRMHYPDGAWDQPGPQWNDRISSMTNNQSTGTESYFYDVTGAGAWDYVFGTTAYDRRKNLVDDTGRDNASMNDRIDRIIPC